LHANRLRVRGYHVQIEMSPYRRPRSVRGWKAIAEVLDEFAAESCDIFTWADVEERLRNVESHQALLTLKERWHHLAGTEPPDGGWRPYYRLRHGVYAFGAAGDGAAPTSLTEEILRSLQALSRTGESFTVQEIWDEMARVGTTYRIGTVRVTLGEMITTGTVSRPAWGRYALRSKAPAQADPARPLASARVVLRCSWCGVEFERERSNVHAG
jgi:hypothetical protein